MSRSATSTTTVQRLAGALGLAGMVALAGPAGAQVDCREIISTPGHKVVVGDVDPALADSRSNRGRVANAIATQVAALRVDMAAEVWAVICLRGWPGGGAEVFERGMIRALDSSKVLIGLWGETNPHEAFIDYVLVPLRLLTFDETSPRGLYAAVHALQDDQDLADLFGNAPELGAYLALALGLKTLEHARAMRPTDHAGKQDKTNYYNIARKYFCRAEVLLQKAQMTALTGGPSSHEWEALVSRARDEADRVMKLAAADDDYLGSITVLPGAGQGSCFGVEG